MLRASSPRTNGSSMMSLRASEMPGPLSSTSIVTSSADTDRRMVASAPNRTAFSTRLVTLRCRSSGRAVIMACSGP